MYYIIILNLSSIYICDIIIITTMKPSPLSLQDIAKHLMKAPKGLLAADESNNSCDKRFTALGISTDEDTRRIYRQLLFTTPNFAQYISGVILYDETIRQKSDNGILFTHLFQDLGVIPGIKVDSGLVDLTNFEGETITGGLDGLPDRLSEYYEMGARFTKWRAAFSIDEQNRLPSLTAIHANLNQMARYATLAQAAGMVPIVEPEVIFAGKHDIKTSEEVTSLVLRVLFDILKAYRADLSGLILKTSMVLAGKDHTVQSTPEEVAHSTLRVLRERVPKETAGVVFLSGGQTPKQATANLNAISLGGKQHWPITFSFSRAVQEPALKAWGGRSQNITKAQKLFVERLAANSLARMGKLAIKNT